MEKYIRMGEYPKEYNPSVHGPYDPSRFYGKPDTPFGEVKLGELSAWFARREKGLRPFTAACSRAFWRWQMDYVQPKRSGIAPFLQLTVGTMIFFYIINQPRISVHQNYKYH